MTAKKSKPKTKPAPAKQPEKESTLDARGHKIGSRKGKGHELFDTEGDAAAFTLGRKLQLKEGTLRSWFMVWRRKDKKQAKATKGAKVENKAERPTWSHRRWSTARISLK